MKINVLKFGGEIALNESELSNLCHSLQKIYEKGEKAILVHGGGPYINELSKRLNLTPRMVGGRRVTDKETLEVVKMTLPGVINSNVLALLKKFQLLGVSVSGISLVKTHKRPPKIVSGSEGKKIDFGFVGDIDDVDVTLLKDLLEKNYLPVVSPMSATNEGIMMNINADTVAVQIAKNIHADRLFLLTSIGGVFKNIEDPDSRFTKLTEDEARKLIDKKIIQGGMIPKLEEGFKLLQGGLSSFHIVNTKEEDTLLEEIKRPGSRGTAITK